MKAVMSMNNFEARLKECLSIKRNVTEIKTLQITTKIMMLIILIAEITTFIFLGYVGLITEIATVVNLILVDQVRLTNYSWRILSCIV